MWNRKAIKQAAKKRMSANYWKMVLVGLILAMLTGSAGVGSSYTFNDGFKNGYDSAVEEEVTDLEAELKEIYEESDELAGMADGMVVGTLVLVFIIVLAISIPLSIFVMNPLVLGAQRFFCLNINQEAELKELGNGFDNGYLNRVKNMFLMQLFIFLWSLLFLIPGIIKSYEYRMIPYLLAENPNMSREDVFAKSKQMMTGNKWKAFVFDLSYFGWFLLSGITCGIVGIFYTNPYYYQGCAMLYDAIKFDCGMNEPVAEVVNDVIAEDVVDTNDTF